MLNKTTLCFFLFFVACLASCSNNHDKPSKTLRLNMTIEPSTFDPRKTVDMASACFQFLINEGLITSRPDNSATFGIASSYNISDDGLEYTFLLRDAYWSDGTKVTAYDYEASWKSMLDPSFPCANAHLFYSIKNAKKVKSGSSSLDSLGVKAIDEKTLLITLESQAPYFPQIASFCTLFCVPEKIALQDNFINFSPLSENYVCNGPFRIKELTQGHKIILEKNPYFYDADLVTLDAIEITFIPDNTTAFELFESGDLDLIGSPFSEIPGDIADEIVKSGNLKKQSFAGTAFCTFNIHTFPFTNHNLRKAVALALDLDEILLSSSKPYVEKAAGLIPPILHPNHKKEALLYASQLSAKEYFQKGIQELNICEEDFPDVEYTFSNTETNKRIAQTIQQQLKLNLGLRVRLIGLESKSFMQQMKQKKFQIAQHVVYAQYPDAMNILERFLITAHYKNYPSWKNDTFNNHISNSCQHTDTNERISYLLLAEKILLEDVPLIPLYHENVGYIANNRVQGLQTNPTGGFYFLNVNFQEGEQ